MTTQCTPPDERERRLDEVVAEYLQLGGAGAAPAVPELLKAHPDLAAELAEFFAEYEQVERMTAPLRMAVAPAAGAGWEPPENYELVEEIGRGGMGVIYKAQQKNPPRMVALKMIIAGDRATAADRQRFRAESAAAAAIDHPHIVPIYEVGEHRGQPFFSMKLIEGGTLGQRIEEWQLLSRSPLKDDGSRPRRSRAWLEERQKKIADLMADVAEAIHFAHQRGVLHRDLKPANILLDTAGQPFVSDFGLAKRLFATEDGSEPTRTGMILGTPSYMAPEQATGARGAVTVSADIYSLGAILYELMVGKPPFRASTPLETLLQLQQQEPERPRTLNPGVHADLETICLRCLEKEPGRRYPTALALAEDLRRFMAGEPIAARPVSTRERMWRWCRQRPGIAGLSAALATLIIVAMPLISWKWYEASANFHEMERHRDAAERRLDDVKEARDKAEKHLKEAEVQRARADDNFKLAHRAVRDVWQNVSEKALYRRPGFLALRRDLLVSVRGYYEQFETQAGPDPQIQRELAALHFRIAQVTSALGSKADALLNYDRARKAYDAIVAANPDDPKMLGRLTQCHINCGAMLSDLGKIEDAWQSLERGRLLGEALVAGPHVSDPYRDMLATIYHNEGTIESRRRKYADAGALYQKALVLREQIVQNHPNDDGYVIALAGTEENLGNLAVDRGRDDEARTWFEKALARQEKLLQAPIYKTDDKFFIALTSKHLSDLERRAGQREAADKYLRKSIGHLKDMRERDPDIAAYALELARCYVVEASVYREDREADKALAADQRARELFERYIKLEPNVRRPQNELAEVLGDIARAHDNRRAPEEAAATLRKALDLRRNLYQLDTKSINYRMDLNATLNNLADILVRNGHGEEARKYILEAIPLAAPILRQRPNDGQVRRYLANNYGVLNEVHRKAGRHKDALAAAEERRRLAGTIPNELLRSARDFALTATPPRDNPNILNPDDALIFARAADRAVETLQAAVQAGMRDPKVFEWKAFDIVRKRADFGEVVKGVAGRE